MQDSLQTSPELGELAKALASAQSELKPAVKDVKGQVGNQKYLYADLAGCLEAIRPVLHKYGLSIVQVVVGSGVNVGIYTILLHSSGQWIRGLYTAEAKDKNPQTVGSVITYLRRYSLSSIVGLSAEDDDGHAAQAEAPAETAPRGAMPADKSKYYFPSQEAHRARLKTEMIKRKVPPDQWESVSKVMDGKTWESLDAQIEMLRTFAP